MIFGLKFGIPCLRVIRPPHLNINIAFIYSNCDSYCVDRWFYLHLPEIVDIRVTEYVLFQVSLAKFYMIECWLSLCYTKSTYLWSMNKNIKWYQDVSYYSGEQWVEYQSYRGTFADLYHPEWLSRPREKLGVTKHVDVIKWKHFPRYWSLLWEFTVHRWIPSQMPVTRSFDIFFDLHLNKRLSKQSLGWWFGTPSRSFWRHLFALVTFKYIYGCGTKCGYGWNWLHTWSKHYFCDIQTQ